MLNDDITALIDSISIPVITGALRCADEFFLTAAAQRNRNHVGDKVCFAKIYLFNGGGTFRSADLRRIAVCSKSL